PAATGPTPIGPCASASDWTRSALTTSCWSTTICVCWKVRACPTLRTAFTCGSIGSVRRLARSFTLIHPTPPPCLFLHAPGISTAAGGCVAYAAATLFFLLILLKPGASSDIGSMKRENLPWFLASAVLVAISQAFVYASLAAAPLMVVTPILQLSLVFRLFLSQLIN